MAASSIMPMKPRPGLCWSSPIQVIPLNDTGICGVVTGRVLVNEAMPFVLNRNSTALLEVITTATNDHWLDGTIKPGDVNETLAVALVFHTSVSYTHLTLPTSDLV